MINKYLNKLDCQSGFTLIEMLVVTGLFATVMVVSISLFATISMNNLRSDAITKLNREGDYIIQLISRKLAEGRDVVDNNGSSVFPPIPSYPNNQNINTYNYQNSYTIINHHGDRTSFRCNSDNFYLDDNELLNNNIEITKCETIYYTGKSGKFSVGLSLQLKLDNTNIQQEFNTRILLRNS